jgi:DNA-binding SARP family transcriptional activator
MGRSVQVETARSHCSGSAAYELRLLGGFQLLKHGDDVETLPSTQRVLAFLALNDRFLPRAYVAESLWPDTTDEKAAANLRTALWRLHVCGHDIIDIVSSRIRLYPSVWIDVRFVENEARHYRATGRVPGTAVLDQVHGELLPGCWDSWLVFERERLRVELIHLYEEIGRAALTRGDEHTAVLAGLAAVACDPLRESSNALLISGYLAGANRPDAIRAFHRFETLLDAELGISPGIAVRRLLTSAAPLEPVPAP